MLLLAATTASAQYVHIELKNGEKYDYDSKDIKTMTVDNEAPKTSGADGQIAGHDYVEIGGKKWATMNIGATSVAASDAVETPSYIMSFSSNYTDSKVYSCFGTYFKWGETTATDGTTLYPTLNSCDNPTLCSKHDAATVNWGSTWRTPTRADMQALSNACAGTTGYSTPKTPTAEITEGGIYWLSATQTHEPDYKGVAGILFVDKADPTKRVFFPAAGYVLGTTLGIAGSYGNYWSSSLNTGSTYDAWLLYFSSGYVYPGYNFSYRNCGFTVRPVSD